MADVKHLVRQWLETEAAFGVVDVPVSPRKKRGKPSASAPALPQHTQIKPAARPTTAAPPATFARPTPTAPVPNPASVPPRPPAPRVIPPNEDETVRKKIVVMPPAPSGMIADLPPITARQKEKQLEDLREKTQRESAPYINDVATKLVFGEGDPDAELMFIGEGPGIEEDKTGRPFVGRSGQLLEKMIGAMGFKREQVYIANVVKLRAAEWDDAAGRLKDRAPTPEEAARGLPVLHAQIEIIRPKVIVTLGAPSVKYVTGTTEGVTKIRGTWLSYRGIPVMPTYHPSFLLRAYTPENRKKVWDDLQMAMKKIGK